MYIRGHLDGIATLRSASRCGYDTIRNESFRNHLTSSMDQIRRRHICGSRKIETEWIPQAPKHASAWEQIHKGRKMRNNTVPGRVHHEVSRWWHRNNSLPKTGDNWPHIELQRQRSCVRTSFHQTSAHLSTKELQKAEILKRIPKEHQLLLWHLDWLEIPCLFWSFFIRHTTIFAELPCNDTNFGRHLFSAPYIYLCLFCPRAVRLTLVFEHLV